VALLAHASWHLQDLHRLYCMLMCCLLLSRDAVPPDITGQLSVSPASIIVKSNAQVTFTMKFTTALQVTAGTVKLFTCTAAGDPQQYLADMRGDSASSVCSTSLALQGP
jgi:hypothetical protein